LTPFSPAQALAAQLPVYPNPASGSFWVRLPAGAATARLTNALGQVVRRVVLRPGTGEGTQAEVDVRGLAPGVYQLHVAAVGATAVRRVVVQ
jgi:hypothetical protein